MSPIFSKTIFNELRREGTLCDAVIRVDGVSFKIHRIVLCNSSMFFRELFCSLSPPSEHQVFSFSQVSPIIMSLILDFIYTGSVLVTEENVLELLAGAECFSVQGAVNACCHFLEQRLNIKNCVHIWMLAEFHKCPKLRQKAYLRAPVFEAVQHWINYAPQERQGHMATLLSKVRLLFLPSNYLVETVINTDVVRKSVSCMTLVIDAMRTLRESNLERPLTRARLPSAVLMTIGGSERESLTDRMDFYDVRANCWLAMESREKALRVLHGCVFLNGFIYCIGGTDLLNILSSVQRFDLVSHNWQELVPIHKPRKCVSAVALNGCIYAIGGTDGSEQKLAERFQPEDNRWVMIAPMLECRSDACAVALDGKIYICGGLDHDEPLSSGECYNPKTDRWTMIASMDSGCASARAVAYQDKIYLAGGHTYGVSLCRVIVYNPLSNQWSSMTPMIYARRHFGMAVLEEQLYVAGGYNNVSDLCKVECYDENTSRWHAVRDMEAPLYGFSFCVVERHFYTASNLPKLTTVFPICP
ncbi:hypothetical protein PBY51_015366 [Eleginops maclovinus]|uniref:BTB domain-containing protein n=2 Tax=Eleginops maclovinus TaxID=56733 RepID=A0AAN7X3D3_ELEMC|nr:hypothetical protein PBY51_015366 [Eleginops maclovinus]